MKDAEKKRREELIRQEKYREQELRRRQISRNKEYTFVSGFFVLIFVSLIAYVIYFDAAKSDEFINSPYNTRQDTFADRVVRGEILSADGKVLAQTQIDEMGNETRVYPYANTFAHVVGYDTNGKSGLESEANFLLLSSHSFFLDQLKNEFLGRKNTGDTVISTLNASLQTAAYDALGDRNGAVIAIEPSTGKILAMVSKPDFDPNTLQENWDYLISDETNSSLLNRAANGQYPPGSTFKTVTSLAYYRKYGTFEKYAFLCQGSITKEDHTIRCYNGTVHGQEDFYTAFANSCNSAFADIGVDLGGKLLRETAEDLLFNQNLPLSSSKSSVFSLDGNSGIPLTMQTAIGQGNTLVSPLHMALITAGIANGGVLMKPYLISQVQNDSKEVVKKERPHVYKRLMSENEANLMGKLMRTVVERGTASSLSGRAYTVAGKTGSAEFNENGASHSWFIGYYNADDPELVVAVIVEGGGTGSEAAVPIAGRIFDTFYENHDAISSPAEEKEADYSEEEGEAQGGWFDIMIHDSYGYDEDASSDENEIIGGEDGSLQEQPQDIPPDDTVTTADDTWDTADSPDADPYDEIFHEEDTGTDTTDTWDEEIYSDDEIIFSDDTTEAYPEDDTTTE